MSIQTEIDRISNNIAAAYTAVEDMGGSIPETKSSDGLAEAVRSMKTGGSLPPGGTAGQVLLKVSDKDGDAVWGDVSGGSVDAGYTLVITFAPDFAGQPYSVTGAGEAYTGTVPDSLTASVTVKADHAAFTVTAATADGAEYSVKAETGTYFGRYPVELKTRPKIYGASWDGSSTTLWSRTDDASDFIDPVPYVKGALNYGSPFDKLQPWAGMVKEERDAGTMVRIPKFWYKLTQNGAGMWIQIADQAVEGFAPSPMHMDRGDGRGERDVAYIGRYHCAASNWKSVTGQLPMVNVTRSAARLAIHNLGTDVWQLSLDTWFSVWMLYLVEFANWNSQKTIGAGCGNNSAVEAMGTTDDMPYHTGTMQTSRDTYGVGVQYRNIEDPWGNCLDWCDGCYNNSSGLNIITNPANFSDGNGGTPVGTPSNGWPSAFSIKNNAGFQMFIPTAANGSEITCSCDGWGFLASYPCVSVGGSYGQSGYRGLFYVGCAGASDANAGLGSRLQELP